jgi:acyl-CoA synthetase (AMP-forming)/AMP-acid ligase II
MAPDWQALPPGPASFADALRGHGEAIALIGEDGETLSYAELITRAEGLLDRIGAGRRLVFLETRNDVGSVVAYVAALLGGHPVYLFHDRSDPGFRELQERYRPNLILAAADGAFRIETVSEDAIGLHPDLRILLSTSGSTGSPKFVKLSERNVLSNARAIAAYLALTPADRAITSLRFSYSYGMSVLNSHLVAGGSLLLTDRSISDEQFWTLARTGGATSFAGVPHTFEVLSRLPEDTLAIPSLRYCTQAGGRLAPGLVSRFARQGRQQGWSLFVMYGQTEAAPRIAYLPPDMAEAHPDCIGRAIPGGCIDLLDADGQPIARPGQPGELSYVGPNVMMGYALERGDLATDETPERLLTGDIAQWTDKGLVRIVGRAGRFVKPFGLRVNLDEIEGWLRARFPEVACTGDDATIVIALPDSVEPGVDAAVVAELAAFSRLPPFVFRVLRFGALPRLSNGKVAYRDIMAAVPTALDSAPIRPRPASIEGAIARNQMTTMLVSGLWHGSAWTFLLWGALHGLFLILQRQAERLLGRPGSIASRWGRLFSPWGIVLQIILVFAAVAFARIFFRAENVTDAWTIVSQLVSTPYRWEQVENKARIALSVAIIVAVVTAEVLVEKGVWRRLVARRRPLRVAVAIVVLMLTLVLGEFAGGQFIYVQF